jgi:hypothetical protein
MRGVYIALAHQRGCHPTSMVSRVEHTTFGLVGSEADVTPGVLSSSGAASSVGALPMVRIERNGGVAKERGQRPLGDGWMVASCRFRFRLRSRRHQTSIETTMPTIRMRK